MTYLQHGAQQVKGVSAAGLTLTWLTVGARCYVRIFMIKRFGMEDWFSLASLITFTLYCAFNLEGADNGFGKKLEDVPLENMIKSLRAWWFCGILYIATTCLLKASVAVQLLTLTDKKIHRRTIQSVLGVSIVYSTAFFFFLLFECIPINHFWTRVEGESGFCVAVDTLGALTIVHSVFNISADWFFAVLPFIILRNLELPRKARITVCLILAVGGLASCIVIIRLPYILILQHHANELLYYSTWVLNCSTAELGLSISAAAMATLRPLFRSCLSASRKTISTGPILDGGCLKLGNPRQRATSRYVRNIDDVEAGLDKTHNKKISATRDSTLQINDPFLEEGSTSEQELRDIPATWVDLSDRRSGTFAERNSASPDHVVQKL